MITSKQRAYLKGLAMNVAPICNIGKGGVTDNFLLQLDQLLEARELVKIQVLKNADMDVKDLINELASDTKSEAVQAIGGKITLYRKSRRENIEHIILPL